MRTVAMAQRFWRSWRAFQQHSTVTSEFGMKDMAKELRHRVIHITFSKFTLRGALTEELCISCGRIWSNAFQDLEAMAWQSTGRCFKHSQMENGHSHFKMDSNFT